MKVVQIVVKFPNLRWMTTRKGLGLTMFKLYLYLSCPFFLVLNRISFIVSFLNPRGLRFYPRFRSIDFRFSTTGLVSTHYTVGMFFTYTLGYSKEIFPFNHEFRVPSWLGGPPLVPKSNIPLLLCSVPDSFSNVFQPTIGVKPIIKLMWHLQYPLEC